jgi:phage/plasmid primase-like uncharacterized protein
LGDRNSSLCSRTEWRWRGKGSLSVRVAGPRLGYWFDHEAGIGGDALALVQREQRCTFPEALAWAAEWLRSDWKEDRPRSAAITHAEEAGRISKALSLWSEGRDPRGTMVGRYLVKRGIGIPPGDVLRFHPKLYHPAGASPGMVALLRDIATDEPCGVHRTYLTSDGKHFDKRMLGRSRGAAIKLCADDEVNLGLGITEGIETALSVMATGWRPVWALGSAGGMRRFPVLTGVEALTIFADHDESGAGEAAAEACARRWAAEGVEVTIAVPRTQGEDFNDCLKGSAA